MKNNLLGILTTVIFIGAVVEAGAAEKKNLAPNPGGEVTYSCAEYKNLVKHFWVKNRNQLLPEGWGVYIGGGKWDYGISSEEKKNGKNSVFVELVTPLYNDKKNINWGSAAILFGGECDGYKPCNSMKVKPGETYCFSFWIKGNIPRVRATATGFDDSDPNKKDKRVRTKVVMYDDMHNEIKEIVPNSEWKEYSAEVVVPDDCAQMTFGIATIPGIETGTNDQAGIKMFIDDVKIVQKEESSY